MNIMNTCHKEMRNKIYSPDRYFLENVIFPYYIENSSIIKILFVGCESYTAWYTELFYGKEYWTIDIKEENRVFGAANHLVDSVQNITRYFSENYFDLIILNGVLGWGLQEKTEVNSTIEACYHCLNRNKKLIIGWNNLKKHEASRFCPVNPDEIKTLEKFAKVVFEPINTWRLSLTYQKNDNRFNFSQVRFYVCSDLPNKPSSLSLYLIKQRDELWRLVFINKDKIAVPIDHEKIYGLKHALQYLNDIPISAFSGSSLAKLKSLIYSYIKPQEWTHVFDFYQKK